MNITNNNFLALKSTNNFIGLKDHSLINNKLKNVLKNSNIVSSNNNVDKLTLSEQASFKIKVNTMKLNDAADEESLKVDQMIENARFSNLVGGIVNSTLDGFKTEIEDSMKSYSSYISKINDGTLDKNISFDDYADSESKKKYQSSSIDVMNTIESQTETSTKSQEIKPSENTESIDPRKKQAFEQLQNRIKKIVNNLTNSLNNIFKGITVSSPELSDSINEIKQNVTSLVSSINDTNLYDTKNESEFAESLKKIFQNINKTQSNIRTFSYNQFKDIPGLDKDYLNNLTYKFQSETANDLKRSQCDMNLIDSIFNSHS